jgi:hypothetical protein
MIDFLKVMNSPIVHLIRKELGAGCLDVYLRLISICNQQGEIICRTEPGTYLADAWRLHYYDKKRFPARLNELESIGAIHLRGDQIEVIDYAWFH